MHLGNDSANGQAFTAGGAVAARVCSLVNAPEEMDVLLEVKNVRMTESVSDQLTVNGKAFPLPVTLELDPFNRTSVATSASPIHEVHLAKGPSEICLVAGRRVWGDVDDFEVDQIVMHVGSADGIDVRRGLLLGQPPPSLPPSVPWGQKQQFP